MTDIATLKLSVDSREVDQAGKSLDKLTGQGAITEKATDRLTKTTETYGKQAKKTSGSVGTMRRSMGQLGFQVQDVAVQLQAGQNAMLILGQQGSQVASIFGPSGAIVGAFLAVGAALASAVVPGLFKTKDATKELETSMTTLEGIITKTKDGTFELTEQVKELAKANLTAANIEAQLGIGEALNIIEFAAKKAGDTLGDMISPGLLVSSDHLVESFKDAGLAIEDVGRIATAASGNFGEFNRSVMQDVLATGKGLDQVSVAYAGVATAVTNLESELGATRTQAVSLIQSLIALENTPTAENMQALQSALDAIAGNDGATLETKRLVGAMRQLGLQADDAEGSVKQLKELIESGFTSDLSEPFRKMRESLERELALFGKTTVTSKLEFDLDKGKLKDLGDTNKQILLGLSAQLDKRKEIAASEKLAAAEASRIAAEKRVATEQLNNLYSGTIQSLDRQKVLHGETGAVAKVRYELEHGALKALSETRKADILLRAQELHKIQEQSAFLAQVDRAINSSLTATEQALRSVREDMLLLNLALEETPEKAEQILAAMERLNQKEREILEGSKEVVEDASVFADQAARNIQDTLGNAINDLISRTEDWETTFIRAILNIVSQAAAADLLSSLGLPGSKGGNLSSLASAAGSLFGGFFADGGRPDPGKVSVVGERGPELFVPNGVSGQIVPTTTKQDVSVNAVTVLDANSIASAMGSREMGSTFINQVRINRSEFRSALGLGVS